MQPAHERTVAGIGMTIKDTGVATILVPCREVAVVIDVPLLVLTEKIRTILFMKDILDHRMDIVIRGRYVSLGTRHHPL